MTLPRPTWSNLSCFLCRIQLPKVLLGVASIVPDGPTNAGELAIGRFHSASFAGLTFYPGLEIAPKLKPLLS